MVKIVDVDQQQAVHCAQRSALPAAAYCSTAAFLSAFRSKAEIIRTFETRLKTFRFESPETVRATQHRVKRLATVRVTTAPASVVLGLDVYSLCHVISRGSLEYRTHHICKVVII